MKRIIAILLITSTIVMSTKPLVAKADPVTESLWVAINKAISDLFYICTKDDSDPQTGGQMLWENIKEADSRNREYMINCLYAIGKYQAFWFTPESLNYIKGYAQEQGAGAYPILDNITVIANTGRHLIDYGNGQYIPSTIINNREYFLNPNIVNKWIETGKMELINRVSKILDLLNIHSLGDMNKVIQDTSTEESKKNAELVADILKMIGQEVGNVTRGLVYANHDFDEESMNEINSNAYVQYMKSYVEQYFKDYRYYMVFIKDRGMSYIFCNEEFINPHGLLEVKSSGKVVGLFVDKWGEYSVSEGDLEPNAGYSFGGTIAFSNTPTLQEFLKSYALTWNGTIYPYVQTQEPQKTYTGIANVETGKGMSLPSNDKPVENYTNEEIHEAIGENDTNATYGDTDATREEILQKTAEEIITRQGEYTSGVLGWLQRLWDGITSLPRKIFNAFKSLLEGITNILNTIVQGIIDVGQFIVNGILDGLKALFIPREGFIDGQITEMKNNFGFVNSIINTGQTIFSKINNLNFNEPPVIYADFSKAESDKGIKYGGEAVVFDLRWYEKYKPTVDLIISGFLWVIFVWRIFVILPNIISGVGNGGMYLDRINDERNDK